MVFLENRENTEPLFRHADPLLRLLNTVFTCGGVAPSDAKNVMTVLAQVSHGQTRFPHINDLASNPTLEVTRSFTCLSPSLVTAPLLLPEG